MVFIFTSLGLVWAMTNAETQVVPEGAIELETANVAFVPDTLRAGGQVTVAVRNRDLFWHTFTIDRLGVDVRAPVGSLRTAGFEAEPGTYSYYCPSPGTPPWGCAAPSPSADRGAAVGSSRRRSRTRCR